MRRCDSSYENALKTTWNFWDDLIFPVPKNEWLLVMNKACLLVCTIVHTCISYRLLQTIQWQSRAVDSSFTIGWLCVVAYGRDKLMQTIAKFRAIVSGLFTATLFATNWTTGCLNVWKNLTLGNVIPLKCVDDWWINGIQHIIYEFERQQLQSPIKNSHLHTDNVAHFFLVDFELWMKLRKPVEDPFKISTWTCMFLLVPITALRLFISVRFVPDRFLSMSTRLCSRIKQFHWDFFFLSQKFQFNNVTTHSLWTMYSVYTHRA